MSSGEQYDAAREWKRRAGEQLIRADQWKADAYHAEALAARYRAALETIAGYGCEFPSAACTDKYVDPDADFDELPCPPCVARAALEAPDA